MFSVLDIKTEEEEHYYMENRDEIYYSKEVGSADECFATQRLLDAKYEKAKIEEVVNEMEHLSTNQKVLLKSLLYKYEILFDGILGNWETKPVDLKLKEGAIPYQAKPMFVLHIHKETLRKEVIQMVEIGVLIPVKKNVSEWAEPSFLVPKGDGACRFVADFRVLNKNLKIVPYPMPRIQDILQELNGFTFATSFDLNMGYWTLRITSGTARLFTIVFPWEKYSIRKVANGKPPIGIRILKQKIE